MVGRIKNAIAEFRWGALPERRARGLVHLHDVLAGTSFQAKYWVIMGLLLGWMRHGGPIPWDRDVDFGFLERDLPAFLPAVEELVRRGYTLLPRHINNDGKITKWALVREGLKYEFFMCEEHGDRLRWYYHRRKPPTEVVNEIPAHGLDEIELYGRRWRKPVDADAYLTSLYGDWRTPNSGYVYWRDCAATIDRYPWSGQRTGT